MSTEEKAWRPVADLAMLRLRAALLQRIRAFFAERDVLEVETPLLASTTTTEPHLASLQVHPGPFGAPLDNRQPPTNPIEEDHQGTSPRAAPLFLQTSPESFMKRLLAAGSGPIYQLCKAFREEEVGRCHNPEFTILEWYRPGFDRAALMDEIDALLRATLGIGPGARIGYAEAFRRHAGLDPFRAPLSTLQDHTRGLGLTPEDAHSLHRDDCLDLILSRVVQPALGPGPVFLSGFPASQAAMARLAPDDPAVAQRFELFVDGIELANGYHELGDAREQRARFLADGAKRRERRLPAVPMDERLLGALAHGMPDCAGVALGVDRLVMLAGGARRLDSVLAFPFSRV
uniref:Lysyl-tRNA synthetase, class 2 n=1 Tax=Candidatus Kentrum eta TaxID=2126337 RepID=A0A450VLP6_9GAMM|nr:MAG: lysyl-tRNA synthetase, class 2 [Candidatus Kentron sp. H]VFK02763.1 MAG: lysyl-tRNA synthetase, class 2 [Candidatus Kentron sp. H]VFK05620.1 MAG: lysyl-tRNA synthetase, class 2 [Candidatus Kentron sp. H]